MKECEPMERRERSEDFRMAADVKYSEAGQGRKPNHHDWTEKFADDTRTAPLNRKQREENGAGQGHDDRREPRAGDCEALNRTENRNRRCDHPIAIQKRSADHRQQGHPGYFAAARSRCAKALRNNGQQGKDPALAVVLCTHYKGQILDRDHHDERPEHQ